MSNATLHASAERLLAYAVEASGADPRPIFQFSDLARELKMSAPTVSRWKRRGVSKGGAAAARARYGCSPAWVLLGIGPRDARPSGGSGIGSAGEATNDPSTLLSAQAAFLEALDEDARRQAIAVLRSFLDAPDQLLESALELELILGGNGTRPRLLEAQPQPHVRAISRVERGTAALVAPLC